MIEPPPGAFQPRACDLSCLVSMVGSKTKLSRASGRRALHHNLDDGRFELRQSSAEEAANESRPPSEYTR